MQDGDGSGWEADRLFARLEERLEAFWEKGNRDAVMAPEAVSEADALRVLVLRSPTPPEGWDAWDGGERPQFPDWWERLQARDGPDTGTYIVDLAAVHVVAALHFTRCLVLGPETPAAQQDLKMTMGLFALVKQFAPEQVPEQIRETVAGIDLPAAHAVAALVATGLELTARWQADGDGDALEDAIRLWTRVLSVLPEGHPSGPMMLSNLGYALRSRHLLAGADADLEDAAEIGRLAVGTAADDDPERSMYLANLAGTLGALFGLRRARADLDDAVSAGLEAVRVAPEPRALYHANTGVALLLRYEQDAARGDLDDGVEALRLAVSLAAPDDPQRAIYLSQLGLALDQRFALLGDPADLDAAVEAATQAVAVSVPGHPARRGYQSTLGNVLRTRAGRSGSAADHADAVAAARKALAAAGPHPLRRAVLLAGLGKALRNRFRRLGDPADIEEAVELLRQSVRESAGSSNLSATSAYDLGHVLLTRFRHTADTADAQAAVDAARLSLRHTAADATDRGIPLSLLGEALDARAQRTGSADDNEEAVAALREARTLLARHHPAALTACLSELGTALSHRFGRTGALSDLDAAVDAWMEGIRLAPRAEDRAVDESHIGGTLMIRFSRTHDPEDLAEALDWHRRAVRSLRGDGDPHAGQVLFNLGRALQAAYQESGDLALLDEALQRMEAGLEAGRTGGVGDALELSNLGALLRIRAERLGSAGDLDRAVDLSRNAVAALPADHPERTVYLTNLSTTLLSRYLRTGSRPDLDDAVHAARRAVAEASPAEPGMLVVALANLSAAMRRRHEWSGALADLDEAVETSRAAVRQLPAGHADTSLHQTNLCMALIDRYRRSGGSDYLDEAIEAARTAVGGVSPEHPFRPSHLSNLALALLHRYRSTRQPADCDEAVALLREAVRLLPHDHPVRAFALANLSRALFDRFYGVQDPEATGAAGAGAAGGDGGGRFFRRRARREPSADIEEAVETAREALRYTPDGDLQYAAHAAHLASMLLMRFSQTVKRSNLKEAFGLYRRAAGTATAPAQVRFRAARAWATAAGAVGDWAEALDAWRSAIAELPLLAWHGLDRADRLDALGRTAGVAGDAAAVALNAGRPEEALQLLEQSRGVLLAQALEVRDDMAELRERAPLLADRIREVRVLLDTGGEQTAGVGVPVDTGGGFEAGGGGGFGAGGGAGAPGPAYRPADAVQEQRAAAERRRELAREMDDLVARARELPGLQDFLRLPSVARLREAAARGPVVVVNTSELRCDALVVTRRGLRTVPLPDLRLEGDGGLEKRAGALLDALAVVGRSPADAWRAHRILVRTLGWLWDAVAAPVLAVLDPADGVPVAAGGPSRLWWCPTGLLSLLPLHAAGHYGAGAADPDGPPKALPDRYACSYTTTLRALAVQTGPDGPGGADPGAGRLLAVDASEAPGLPALPHARAEARLLTDRVAGTTLLAGDRASRRALLDALPAHAFLHFAGHGSQDPGDSAGGALYCHDHGRAGPLTAADIARLRLDRAELAFLSACETARGAAGLPDEAVHLAGALQLAGFTHVVAAQWAVDDASALRAVDHFYAGLAAPGAAAAGTPGTGAAGPRGGSVGGLDAGRAATALHGAVQRLREQDDDPLWWAAYVHTGP
ncbi:CHAT domain-containing protein [Streptomyces sp. NBC_00239]|uniref:CHAT domain-containing protein n=1 Tax=Streptomyces sp. NBC_00239 TaxID=2903640 RepID=UPI002E2ADDFA|nr:CHAT domain-containing protein [Streptomyces sp. NBC_00239]